MHPFVEQLLHDPVLGRMVVHRQRMDGAEARYADTRHPLTPEVAEALASQGFGRLYSHQARALDHAAEGRDVVLVTPTASGKSLLFGTTILETLQREPDARALLLYPTKALAQDQLIGLRSLAGGLGALRPPRFDIYDGDTPPQQRKKIKTDPPQALITNPDMLHMGILAHHDDWEAFLSRLRWVILDELHVYRGLFGSHVHHILGRLRRICARFGADPRFLAASATVGNPGEFARLLTGRPFEVVGESGAPRAERQVVFVNPSGVSPYTVAVRVVAAAMRSGLRTIAFTKARRVTELLHTWLVRQAPELERKVAPYRAGYLPEERRRLERQLHNGDLSAIFSTSALELGIDVGGLDVCVLVGYPGSLVSSWQRIGRVGRKGRPGIVVLIAMPDALDQYLIRHPELFFGDRFETAILDPANPLVAGRHLVCAASEHPLQREELRRDGVSYESVADALVRDGRLVLDAAGKTMFSLRRRPHRDVNLRSAGEPFSIVERGGRPMGSVDGRRVYHECHPGAVYLHGGVTFQVLELDRERRRVIVQPARVDYYTVVLGEKETEILETLKRRMLGPFHVGLGRLKVTVRIRDYQKKRLYDGESISTHALDVPPLIFETVGFWIELPPGMAAAYTERELHFMGGIHAAEHAAIGLFPLLTIADRNDVGGISYTGHPQIGGPAVFVYDGVPGGAGLAEQGFDDLDHLLARTLEQVEGCPCEEGCPACIQSPNCGNGNKPLDKRAAVLTLRLWTGGESLDSLGVEPAPAADARGLAPFVTAEVDTEELARRHGVARAGNLDPETAREVRDATLERMKRLPAGEASPAPAAAPAPAADLEKGNVLFFDLETQRSADEVGGWSPDRLREMRLGLAVVYDARRNVYRTYYEADVDRLLFDLAMADHVVGFNLDRFDLPVLSAYTDQDLGKIRTVDMLALVHQVLGFRISLEHLSEVNLGESKAGGGLQSLQWWKEGRLDLIEQYCRKDVELTRRLYELGRDQRFLLYRDHQERTVRVPVDW